MKWLIINADDFGIHESVNLGIIRGYSDGCITSTTIMPSGKAFEHAVELSRKHPALGVGVHLTLVGELPVAGLDEVPSLVDGEGRLASDYSQFLRRFVHGQVCLDEVRRELTAQVAKVVASGISITHLDSHQHMHVVPGIIDVVLAVAKEFNIKALRIPAESVVFFGGYSPALGRVVARSGLSFLSTLAGRKAKRNGFNIPDHFFGMLAGGNMCEKLLLNIIESLPDGVSEVMLHPGTDDKSLNATYGWQYNWQSELAAVTSEQVLRSLGEKDIKLVSFRELTDE